MGPANHLLAKRLVIAALMFFFLVPHVQASGVVELEIRGPITYGTSYAISEAIKTAQNNDSALLILVDTPGGSTEYALEILKAMEKSRAPIITYVQPSGSRVMAAGIAILAGSNIVAMSPGTYIGSSRPMKFYISGYEPVNDYGEIDDLLRKLNETASMKGRNIPASLLTSDARLGPEEAQKHGINDVIVGDKQALLSYLDGKEVKLPSGTKILRTKGAEVNAEKNIFTSILVYFTNPLLAFLLLIFGIYLTIFGITSLGFGAELVGVALLSVGAMGALFNIDPIGAFLLIAGVALLVKETHTPGFGAIGASGILLLTLGSVLLVPANYPGWLFESEFRTFLFFTIAVPSLLSAGFLIYAFRAIYHKSDTVTFIDRYKGQSAIADDDLGPGKEGCIIFMGERWRASSKEEIKKGEQVIILGTKGKATLVKKQAISLET